MNYEQVRLIYDGEDISTRKKSISRKALIGSEITHIGLSKGELDTVNIQLPDGRKMVLNCWGEKFNLTEYMGES